MEIKEKGQHDQGPMASRELCLCKGLNKDLKSSMECSLFIVHNVETKAKFLHFNNWP